MYSVSFHFSFRNLTKPVIFFNREKKESFESSNSFFYDHEGSVVCVTEVFTHEKFSLPSQLRKKGASSRGETSHSEQL